MHLSQSFFENIRDCTLNRNCIFLNLIHFTFNMDKLLLDIFFLFVQLDVVFQSIVICITVGLLNSYQGALVLLCGI